MRRTSRWKQKSKLDIFEAVSLYGERRIAAWDGRELAGRPGLQPPERPWLHYGSQVESPKRLIFNEDGNPSYVDAETAERWWSLNEAKLTEEWQAELQALKRWRDASGDVRDLLAEGKLSSELMTESGLLVRVSRKEWRRFSALQIFTTGEAQVYAGNPPFKHTYQGIVLIERQLFDSVVEEHRASPSTNAPPFPFDPKLFPYVAFMVRTAGEIPSHEGRRLTKKEIEGYLRANWPKNDELGKPTKNKIRTMATFLRRPEDERGGAVNTSSPKGRSDKAFE
jgi:hypothetical protein